MISFTHLETYSYYTLLGSPLSVTDLVARTSAEGMSQLALIDTGWDRAPDFPYQVVTHPARFISPELYRT